MKIEDFDIAKGYFQREKKKRAGEKMQYWTDVSIWRISNLTAAAILNKTSKTNSNILAFFPMTTLSGGFSYFPRSSILGLSKMSLFSCLSEGSSVTIWLIWSFSKLTLALFTNTLNVVLCVL